MYTPTDALQILIFVFPVQSGSRGLCVQVEGVTAGEVMSIRTSPFTLAEAISYLFKRTKPFFMYLRVSQSVQMFDQECQR